MAEIDAKVNMSLDDIIKLERKDKKKKGIVNGKGVAKNNNRPGKARRNNNNNNNNNNKNNKSSNVRGRGANKSLNGPKKSQAWRLQRPQMANNFVAKKYRQNGNLKKVQSKSNLNLNAVKNGGKNKINQSNASRTGFIGRRGGAAAAAASASAVPRAGRIGTTAGLTRSRSRNNVAGTKRFLNAPKGGLKRVNSLPNLRDPNSVYNRLGYQSPAQAAYRSRVKRAKQVLLQRQSQRLLPNDRLVPRPVKALTTLQQRALERRQQILSTQRSYNTGGLRSDQIIRAQRRQQYTQKLMRMNAARVNPNPNVNFMCTLGDNYAPGNRSRSNNQDGGLHGPRQLPRGRSPFRQNSQNLNSMSRGSLFNRPRSRSRSRSRSRTRTVPLIHSGANVDDRTFSEVMYSVSNNLGVTGRTLNDRFTF